MDGHAIFIEVRIYRLVMISIDLSEKAQKNTLEIQEKIQSEIKSENFFPDKIIFLTKKKFLGFCLGTEFCLRLHTAVVFRMHSFNIHVEM